MSVLIKIPKNGLEKPTVSLKRKPSTPRSPDTGLTTPLPGESVEDHLRRRYSLLLIPRIKADYRKSSDNLYNKQNKQLESLRRQYRQKTSWITDEFTETLNRLCPWFKHKTYYNSKSIDHLNQKFSRLFKYKGAVNYVRMPTTIRIALQSLRKEYRTCRWWVTPDAIEYLDRKIPWWNDKITITFPTEDVSNEDPYLAELVNEDDS
jgi:hypothetical protein